jgi:hypothetical protein
MTVDPEQSNKQNSGVPRNEKQEKGQEKTEEKGKGPDEKYQKNPVGFMMFAVLLFWVGIYFLLKNRHIIDDTDRGWALLVWGVAVLSFVEIVIRLAVPRFRQNVAGTFVWAAIWTGVGAGLWSGGDWDIIGPLVLIAIAVALVVGRLLPRR